MEKENFLTVSRVHIINVNQSDEVKKLVSQTIGDMINRDYNIDKRMSITDIHCETEDLSDEDIKEYVSHSKVRFYSYYLGGLGVCGRSEALKYVKENYNKVRIWALVEVSKDEAV